MLVSARLTRDAQQRAASVDLQLQPTDQPKEHPITWHLDYSYDPPLSVAGLPSVCVRTTKSGTRTFKYSNLEIAASPLPEDAFRIYPYRGKDIDYVEFVLSNSSGNLYYTNHLGMTQVVRDPRRNARISEKSGSYGLVVFTLLAMPAIFLFWSTRRKATNQTK